MKKTIIFFVCLGFTSLSANSFKSPVQSTQHKKVSANKQELLKAFKWHHKSAIKGSTESQYQLALMFHYGSGVRKNEELAKLWFTRASKKGHTKAQSILYRFYAVKNIQYASNGRTMYSQNIRR